MRIKLKTDFDLRDDSSELARFLTFARGSRGTSNHSRGGIDSPVLHSRMGREAPHSRHWVAGNCSPQFGQALWF